MRNAQLKFICRDVYLQGRALRHPFTRGYNAGQVIRVPVAHGEGNFVADADTIARIEGEGRVVFRYCAPDGTLSPGWNVNGATNAIAGIVSEARQCARHDAASGEPRGGRDRLDRRPRPVRRPRGASEPGGVIRGNVSPSRRARPAAAAPRLLFPLEIRCNCAPVLGFTCASEISDEIDAARRVGKGALRAVPTRPSRPDGRGHGVARLCPPYARRFDDRERTADHPRARRRARPQARRVCPHPRADRPRADASPSSASSRRCGTSTARTSPRRCICAACRPRAPASSRARARTPA